MRTLFLKTFKREMIWKNISIIIGLCLFLGLGMRYGRGASYLEDSSNLAVLYYQWFFLINILILSFVYEKFRDQKIYTLLYSLPMKRREFVDAGYFYLLFNTLISLVISYFLINIFAGFMTGSFSVFTDLKFLLYLIPYILIAGAFISHGHINLWGRWVNGLIGGIMGFSLGYIEMLYRDVFIDWSLGDYLKYISIRLLILGAIYIYTRYKIENKDIY